MYNAARALKEDVSDYDRHLKTFGKKRPKLKVMLSDGHPVDCYGPFKCRLNIGPTPVRMTVWVTADPHFGVDFVLGRYDWPVMALKTMHQPPADRPPHNEAHIQCQGPDNREIRTLVDTGAGPNVLSYDVFKRMGYREQDLQPSLFKLSMADSTDLATAGYFPNLVVRILDTQLRVPCTVVKGAWI